jgi:hypothetical protein
MRGKQLLLYAVFLTAVAGYLYRDEAVLLAMTDDCDATCGPTAACDEACYKDLLLTTCGQYDGGHENDWCDGDTCEDICSALVSSNWACWMDGDPVTCFDYGEYAECGDGFCASVDGGETHANCEEDCGPAPPSPTCGQDGCEPGETWRSCPQDCDEPDDDCGDGNCARNEDGESCPQDCTFSGDLGLSPHTCPTGFVPKGEYCVWASDPLYVCCESPMAPVGGQNCGGPQMCTATEVCGYLPNVPVLVCQPRWPGPS